jgi:pimeloyl-ACP methyl ester carboxylesterase
MTTASAAGCVPSGQVRRASLPLLVAVLAVVLLGCSGKDRAPAAGGSSSDTSATGRSGEPLPEGQVSSPGPGPADPADAFAPAPVRWSGCEDGIECATLTVPLDYQHPGGATQTIALNRRPASKQGKRRGSLLINPGGPGGGKELLGELVSSGSLPPAITDVYDIVGFDPRGVGDSQALDCGSAQIDAYRAVDASPDDPAEQAALDDAAASVGAACQASDGPRLASLGTDSVVRDMEMIRRVVGDPKLTYLGFSYGTLLGLRYLKLFPQRAAAMVLDGVVDPTADLPTLLEGQAIAFEAALERNLSGPGDLALYDKVSAEVERQRLPAGKATVGPTELATAADLVAYSPNGGPTLVKALKAADGGDGTQLHDLAEQYWTGLQFSLYIDVECIDSAHPVGRAAWADFAGKLGREAPRVGFSIANEMAPCAEWPVPPEPVTGPVDGAGGPPVLVVGTSNDPATPYSQAVSVAHTLVGGHLLSFEGNGHTAWADSSCVREAGAAYLVDGTLPGDGTTCKK